MKRKNRFVSDPVIDTYCPEDREFSNLLEEVSATARYKKEKKWARVQQVRAAKERRARR